MGCLPGRGGMLDYYRFPFFFPTRALALFWRAANRQIQILPCKSLSPTLLADSSVAREKCDQAPSCNEPSRRDVWPEIYWSCGPFKQRPFCCSKVAEEGVYHTQGWLLKVVQVRQKKRKDGSQSRGFLERILADRLSAAGSRKHRVLAGAMTGKIVRFGVTGGRALGAADRSWQSDCR